MPLFVPHELLAQYRRDDPRLWVEASPELPVGRLYTAADIAETR